MFLGLGLPITRGGGVPFYADATVALDFANNRYRNGLNAPVYADPSLVSGWSFSRTGVEYAATSSGLLVPFASGVPAVTDLGLQVWEARTNSLCRGTRTLLTRLGQRRARRPSANALTDPAGTALANRITRSSTAATYVAASVAKAASSLVYTFVGAAKVYTAAAGTARYLAVRMMGTYPARVDAQLDLQTGTFSLSPVVSTGFTGASGSVIVRGSWVYFTVTATSDAVASVSSLLSPSNVSGNQVDGTDTLSTGSVDVFLPGIRQAAFAGPLIANASGASATRGAASASVGVTLPPRRRSTPSITLRRCPLPPRRGSTSGASPTPATRA
jgi:hypothetical protein